MKNKHLVLLFLTALIVGLLTRKAPWAERQHVHACIVRLDTTAVSEIIIRRPGADELSLLRTETGWAAMQNKQSLLAPNDLLSAMFGAMHCMRARRIIQTKQPDTLGVTEGQGIEVRALRPDGSAEIFWVGRENSLEGSAACYLRLPEHEGIYLAEGDLHRIFNVSFEALRPNRCFQVNKDQIVGIVQEMAGVDTLSLQLSDSLNGWIETATARLLPADSMAYWFGALAYWAEAPFADYFDASTQRNSLLSTITLRLREGDEVMLRFYRSNALDLPEELQHLPKGIRSACVMHSSQRPHDFFAIPDTTRLQQLCQYLFRINRDADHEK